MAAQMPWLNPPHVICDEQIRFRMQNALSDPVPDKENPNPFT